MALVDADYKFLYVDVGAQGRISDAGVYSNCRLSKELEKESAGLPAAEFLTGTDLLCPYMIVADDAFPLKSYLMKPYSRRGMLKNEVIFNYRLSRCRRTVENAFGQFANRFRIFRAPMLVQPETAKKIVLACCALHNFLNIRERSGLDVSDDTGMDVQLIIEDRDQRSGGLTPLQPRGGTGRLNHEAKMLRDKLAEYFVGPGSVAWQERMTGFE
jgi:hypothetical protein